MSRPALPIIRLPRPDGRRVAEPLARSSLSADERARRADKPAIGIEIVNGIGLARCAILEVAKVPHIALRIWPDLLHSVVSQVQCGGPDPELRTSFPCCSSSQSSTLNSLGITE